MKLSTPPIFLHPREHTAATALIAAAAERKARLDAQVAATPEA